MIPVLVTRPVPDGEESAGKLAAIGFEPRVFPLLAFSTLPIVVPSPVLSGVVLTSANAVRALQELGLLAPLVRLPVYAVGDKTARAAADAGFLHVHSAAGDASDLIDLVLSHLSAGGTLFYPHGAEVSHNLKQAFGQYGIAVEAVPVYEMVAVKAFAPDIAEDLRAGRFAAVTLYSRRTADIFATLSAQLQPTGWAQHITAMCLSENVAAGLAHSPFKRIALAETPSEESMMALALSFARGHN